MTPADLRRALPRAYYPFFGRHGRPRRIQLEAAAPLLSGRDALLMAPSAAGKTEAYGAPLCERLLAEAWEAPGLLVVSPTRALANDLHRRLRGPVEAVGIPLGRWTGERKEPSGGGLPAVTILTPESLDARLSRGPAGLRMVRCAVLDELHVLDGRARGDHLRILVERLRRLAGSLQVVAASATVADPEDMARRYLRDAAIVEDATRLVLRARVARGTTPVAVGREIERLARAGVRKFLVFANRRRDVEEYAAVLARLAAFRGAAYAHHGSLSKRERERAEEGFLRAPRAVCVATMTLELGIDIGDVDVVGLLEPPHDVAALVQRIGRSGRRGAGPRAVLFAAGPAEVFRYRTLLELAREGDLAADPPCFHPSVLVQQALSILHQNPGRWVSARAIRQRLDPMLAAAWTEARLEGILEAMEEQGWLEPAGRGRYVEGEEAERRWPRGTLHSNIADPAERDVIDQLTGERIGTIASPSEEGAAGTMRMAGRARRIVWADEERIVVRDGAGGAAPQFAPRGVPLASRALAQAHARRLGLEEGEWPLVAAGGRWLLFHFLGTAGGEVLAGAFAEIGKSRAMARGPFALDLPRGAEAAVPAAGLADLEAVCRGRRDRLARVLGMGPYHRLLPGEEADRALFEALDLAYLAALLASAEICDPPRGRSREFWEGLAGRS